MSCDRVDRFLLESAALERFRGARVTAEMLQRESERIARETQLPDRLLEIYEALGNDSLTIQECLIRPTLVRRLLRNRDAAAPKTERVVGAKEHGLRREAARVLRGRAAGRLPSLAVADLAVVADPTYAMPYPRGVGSAGSWSATENGGGES